MRKVKILYVITKLELGGAQKHLLSLIQGLDQEKFDLYLFTAYEGLLIPEAALIKNLTLVRSKSLKREINLFKDIFVIFQISKVIRNYNIDIVHTHSSKAGIVGRWAAKISGVKVIIHTVHGWPFNDLQKKFTRSFYIMLEKITSFFTDKLIVVSNFDKQLGLYNKIGSESLYALIHYGIDYNEFSSVNSRIKEELGLKTDDLVVGMVSCFKPQKYPQDFVGLAAKLKDEMPGVKFILVGDGVLRKEIEGLIKKFSLEDNVFLLGWRRDIPNILSGLDLFVLTSLWEGLPISALEAMASSKPIITTHTGGISEIVVNGQTGFIVPRFDIETMANKVKFLLSDQGLRKEIGNNCRAALGDDFCIENMLNVTQGLYKSLMSLVN